MTSAVAFADGVDACHEAASESVVGSSGKIAVASGRRLSGEPVRGCPASSWSCVEPSDDEVLAEFGALFVRLHWDTIRAELDHAVEHLTERTSEGTALLHRQLVQGAVADVALALSDSAGLLDLPKTRHRLWRVHLGLVAASRNLLKLFGGASFLADGPGSVLYLAELLGNVYLHPGRENSRG
jgi:hypothetical protein